jgi:hypothetical protein
MRTGIGFLLLALMVAPPMAMAQTGGYGDRETPQRADEDETARQDYDYDSRFRDFDAKRAQREAQGYERERIGPEGRRLLIKPPDPIDPYDPQLGRFMGDLDSRR